MTKETFQYIKEKVDIYYKESTKSRHNSLSCSEVLVLTISYLANQSSYRELANSFGLSKGFVHTTVTKILDILNILAPEFIKWPTKEEAIVDEKEFKKYANFPGVIGAIDGCHIKIKAPSETQMDYLDRTLNHSINLLAVCDSNKKFTFVYAGFPGSAHDNRVYANSGLPEKFTTRKEDFFPPGNYHIIGDSAFAVSPYLLVPFKDYGNLQPKEKKYNQKLSKTRVVIENAFGLL